MTGLLQRILKQSAMIPVMEVEAVADDTADRSTSWRDDPEAVESFIQEHLQKDRSAGPISKVFDGYVNHKVHSNGVVDLKVQYFNIGYINNRQIRNYLHRIPINLGRVTGSIMAHGAWIESFDGFPTYVSELINISGSSIESWTGLPSSISYLTVSTGLKKTPIDVNVAAATTLNTLNFNKVEPGLCLPRVMFFRGLSHVALTLEGEDKLGIRKSSKIMHIVDQCLKNYPHDRKGALQLQRELIEHDFDEFSDL